MGTERHPLPQSVQGRHSMFLSTSRRHLSCVVVGVAAVLVACRGQATAADLQTSIDSLAKPLIADGTAVGFVVGVTQNGKTQFLSYGETAKGSRTTPDPDTVYEVGSVTKVFTATRQGRHADPAPERPQPAGEAEEVTRRR
jgi:CubicO group peptidase (beta-lactamase class C family)